MSLNDVKITKILKGLNRPAPSTDSIFAMVAGAGSALPTGGTKTISANVPVLLHGIEDAEDYGITAAYDTSKTVLLWHQLNQHFKFAPGQPLWLYLVAQGTSQADMCDQTATHGIMDLINQCSALPYGDIKVVYTVLNPANSYTPTITDNIDEDVTDAIANAQALADTLFDAHRPIDIILEGRSFGTDAAGASDLRLLDKENVSVVIAQDYNVAQSNALHHGYAAVGTYAGLAASKYFSLDSPNISIGNNPTEVGLDYRGNIQDLENGYFVKYGMGNQQLSHWSLTQQGTLYDKHYVTLRVFPKVPGVYFSQSWTCAADDNDITNLQISRVYNKAANGIYQAYVPYINTKVKLTDKGTLPGEVVKALESVGNKVFIKMAAEGDLSDGRTFIDASQQLTSTRKLVVKWKIIPDGYLESIEGELSYTVTI